MKNKNETPSFSSDLKSIIYQHSFMFYGNSTNLITKRKEKYEGGGRYVAQKCVKIVAFQNSYLLPPGSLLLLVLTFFTP